MARAMPHARRFLSTKKIIVAGIIVFVVAGSVAVTSLVNQQNTAENSGSGSTATAPSYQTALPGGKSIDELGGWQRVSPPGKDPVFAYADKIGNVPISVSQQPLPDSFKNNTEEQVAELAKKFNATDKLDAGETKVYIGTSAKGPQSAILAKNNVLILIKSQKKIDSQAWEAYASSLQ